MSFDSFYQMITGADTKAGPQAQATTPLVQEAQDIQRTLGQSSAATRDVSAAHQALDIMRALPQDHAQGVWKQLDGHQQMQLELELLKEKGTWHNSTENAAGVDTKRTQDHLTTVAEVRNLQPTNQAEKTINQGLQHDIYNFTENNSLKGSPYEKVNGASEQIFLSHVNTLITDLDQSEKQHEFDGNLGREQQYRHPSQVVVGGPLFDGGNIIKP